MQGGLVTEADLDRARAYPRKPGERLGQILMRLGALSEGNLSIALAEQTGYSLVTLLEIQRDGIAAPLQGLGWNRTRVTALRVGLWEDENTALHACAEDPLDIGAQEALGAAAADTPPHWQFMRSRDLERLLASLGDAGADGQLDAARYRAIGALTAFRKARLSPEDRALGASSAKIGYRRPRVALVR